MSRRPPSPEQEEARRELLRRAQAAKSALAAADDAQDALDEHVRDMYERRFSQAWIGEVLGGVPQQTISNVIHGRGRTPTDRIPKATSS